MRGNGTVDGSSGGIGEVHVTVEKMTALGNVRINFTADEILALSGREQGEISLALHNHLEKKMFWHSLN